MESSVCLCAVLGFWITVQAKKCITTTTQGILQFLGDKLCIIFRRFYYLTKYILRDTIYNTRGGVKWIFN